MCSCFCKVSEKSNGWIKYYGAKSFILAILGSFLTPLTPLGFTNQNFPKVKDTKIMYTSTLLILLASFRKKM